MNLTYDAVLAESPNYMNLVLLPVHTSDEFGSLFILTTRIVRPADGSNWLLPVHLIGEGTEDRVSRMGSEQNYNVKTDFEIRRENQDFGPQNNSMSQPILELTPLSTNTTNGTTSPTDSIPVEGEMPEPTTLTQPTEFLEKNGKGHVLGDPDPDPSFSDSSPNKYNLLNNRNSSKSNKSKRDKKKKN